MNSYIRISIFVISLIHATYAFADINHEKHKSSVSKKLAQENKPCNLYNNTTVPTPPVDTATAPIGGPPAGAPISGPASTAPTGGSSSTMPSGGPSSTIPTGGPSSTTPTGGLPATAP